MPARSSYFSCLKLGMMRSSRRVRGPCDNASMASKRQSTFDPSSAEPFRISRSKIDLFSECPRCAYLDMRLGVKRPSMPAFTLNNAVDELLKREFDIHRAKGTKHPLVEKYGLDAVPLVDERMDEWRDAL